MKALLAAPLRLALLPLVVLALVAPAMAQVQTGSISGTVRDTDGEPLPGAVISIMAEGIMKTATTVSNESGSFHVSLLPPANYQVTITMAGFQTATYTVTVTIGGTADASATLQLGG